ncbi:MAG: hypothetical protein IT305_13170 [Chloroflexi bacterium]|nr:hypothetical protein [Chloroflexota bacterium]
MIGFLNRYSYLIASGLAMGGAWLTASRFGGVWPAVAVAGVGAGLALFQRQMRGGPSALASWDELSAAIGRGIPLLLFLYSDT